MKIQSLEPMQAIEAPESMHLDDMIEEINSSKSRYINTDSSEEPPISSEDEHTKKGLIMLAEYLDKQKNKRKKHKKNSPLSKYQALQDLDENLQAVGNNLQKAA